jgi:hypothetical protein
MSHKGRSITHQTTANALISCAETWPAKTQHGSVGLSLQLVFVATDASLEP